MKALEVRKQFEQRVHDDLLVDLYEDHSLVEYQNHRYINALDRFVSLYDDCEVEMYSAAGRSEVGGNHTDHQHGCVLAASINLDAIAVVTKQSGKVKVVSDSFDIDEIDINELDKREHEEGTSEALIRGVLAGLKNEGYNIEGFKAFITSDVLMGAGLSSSAAFEVLIGTILSGLYNDMAIDMVTIAKVGQYAENVYFGKPCGLMDQCACAVGGLISIDFDNPAQPVVEKVDVDFSTFNHSLCIVDTKGSHADLTDEYAAVPFEMKSVAKFFGKEVLRDVSPCLFMKKLPEIREKVGDRAILRAIHFFEENERVKALVDALNHHRFEEFMCLIKCSGNSSFKYLQNVFSVKDTNHQSVSVALAVSELTLGKLGVSRVHGGGFAGTIQAFVDNEFVAEYKTKMEKVFGEGSCHVLRVRKYGGKKVL
ncbi:MAG: galactokinase [Erysipelotrichaceae bacterium]|nr:galactokinase [Erysipelotrichaceae bacterium]